LYAPSATVARYAAITGGGAGVAATTARKSSIGLAT
jgi:hypothetical protein